MSVLLNLAAAVIVIIWLRTRTGNKNRVSPFYSFNWRVYFGFLGLLLLAAGTASVLPIKKCRSCKSPINKRWIRREKSY